MSSIIKDFSTTDMHIVQQSLSKRFDIEIIFGTGFGSEQKVDFKKFLIR